MENSTVSGLRSRSRSKTPFLRSSCDRESCGDAEEHTHHKSGRKTPVKRSTPIKQLNKHGSKAVTERIEEVEEHESPPAHRTRQSAKGAEKLVKTSDYSSEESLDRLRERRKEVIQNEINSHYERVSTSSRGYSTLADVTLSPIAGQSFNSNVSQRTTRFGSPTYSGCSTDSSFAEQALADASVLLDTDPSPEHLPYRLYKMAGEYWNKYPKTDYTYSPLSRDRVELAPGQVAVPNMSRRSLSQFRVQGPNTSVDELDRLISADAYVSKSLRKRITSFDGSDDEGYLQGNGGFRQNSAEQRWWLTRLLISIVTTITTATSSAYTSVVGPSHRYPYTDRRPSQPGLPSRAASAAAAAVAAPFYWIYTIIKKIVTTTVTTVTETITPNHVSATETYTAHAYRQTEKRRWWPWLLLLLLPFVGYGSRYAYEHLDEFAMPNFTDFHLDFPEFSSLEFPTIALPNISLPEIPNINISLPEITMPDFSDNLPEVSKAYREYKDIVQNRVSDASDYMKVVAESCFEEMRRYWNGIIG